MKYVSHLNLFVILFFFSPSVAIAQKQPQEFELPTARVGEDYRAEIESVLREKYQLRLESGNTNRVIRWTMSSGEVPEGLSVRTDGTIIGKSNEGSTGIYQFSLKAVDMAVRDELLELHFSLEVKAGRLRLSRIESPRLVPVNSVATPNGDSVLDSTNSISVGVTPDRANNSRAADASATPEVTPTPSPVTGRVTAINEQIFTNADEFTPDQIRRAVKRVVDVRAGRALQPVDKDVPTIVMEGTGTIVRAHSAAPNLPQILPGNLILKKDNAAALDTPLAEVTVKVEKPGDDTFPKEFKTDYQGNYTTTPLNDGSYVFSVKMGDYKTLIPVTITAGVAMPNPANLQLLVRPLGEFSRAIVGFEQAGASAAKSTQKYFFDLTLSHPLPFQKSVDPYFGPRGRMWGTVRVTSVPQQISTSLGTFATGFAQQVSEVKVNEVAQAVEFLAGVDVRLTNRPLPFGSFGGQTATKLTLSFIAGGGATTPFNPRETLEVFKAFPGAPGLPALPTGTEFVAFVSPDRDRFFRQFYGGLRLQTHYFDYRNPSIPLNRYPAQLDITYGQNEAITGGRLRGGVIRIEGFYPLPYDELKFINLFGTALIRPVRTNITDPLILQPAPSGTVVPANNVLLITVPQINRDYYRLGVGIDFISFVKKLGAGQSK